MKKIAVALATMAMMFAGTSAVEAKPSQPKNETCSNETLTGTYKNVTVERWASCTLDGATVLGNVKANDVYDVKVLNTEVKHNIMIRESHGDVVVGIKGCKIDPPAGNNVMVKDSHNVLICQMTVDNNIKVSGNDGRISLFHNKAGNNIMVTNNLRYTPYDTDEPTTHKRPGAIRIRHNQFDNHLMVRNNEGRKILRLNNTQF